MDVQTYELVLLGGALAVLALLLPLKKRRAPIPWTAVGMSALGIVVLVAHALRETIARYLGEPGSWLDPASAQWTTWRLVELMGLVIVGVGVVLLAQSAEHERVNASRRRQLDALAPSVDISAPLLRALIQTSPGTMLLLTNRAGAGEQPRFHVAFVDESGTGQHAKKFGAGRKLLTEIYTPSLAEGIYAVARRALLTNSVADAECKCAESGRCYTFSAAAHGQSVIVMLEDISERRKAEESLRRVAYTDPVTGLANRPMLEQALEKAIEASRGEAGDRFAVIYVDFDGFKSVNDRHGHHVGDALLASIGQRIAKLLEGFEGRSPDENIAARWGGDEFVILLGESRVSEVDAFAQRLLESLGKAHQIEGVEVNSTASIGVVVCRGQYETHMDVVRDADAAMYEAKRLGRNRIIKGGDSGKGAPFQARRQEDWQQNPGQDPGENHRKAG
ncbi:MAG: diguanylate cyclase domain-containing protein [Phycisphaerales bacterium JB059]